MQPRAFNTSYVGARPDIEALFPASARSVLDVGCSTGVLGAAVKQKLGARVVGIELDRAMAAEAATRIDEVHVGDAVVVLMDSALDGQRLDVIVFADVLEHLVDPWAVLCRARDLLSPGGCVITSIPNIRHIDTIFNLLVRGYWPYRDRGIHDRTHLRFFTKRNVYELFDQAKMKIERIETNYRLRERPKSINRIAKWFALPGLRNFLAFQYIVRAVRW